ncbi:MAG: TrkH family potassium uptake protein [Pseudomonadota bacterium]
MRIQVILRVFGLLLMMFSVTMVPPIILSVLYKEPTVSVFTISLAASLIVGFLMWWPFHRVKHDLRTRDGFMIVVLFWTGLSVFGALPFVLLDTPDIRFVDAFFESVSGLTTTGATVFSGIDYLPKSVLYHRQQLHFFGGMGIIVLAVAILPMLGVGGMQLYRAETTGPVKDSKLTPRITETAKALWYIYLSLNAACALGLWLAGMNIFDAICHAVSAVSSGGFGNYDANMSHFNSFTMEMIIVVFMILGTLNFSLHFFAWQQKSLSGYWQDTELRVYLSVLAFCTLACSFFLIKSDINLDPLTSVRQSLFQTVSIASSTGYVTASISDWPIAAGILLMIISFMGGCAGSTGGGIKVIRIWLMLLQGSRETKRLIHPAAILSIKVGNKPVPERVIEAVSGFVGAYIFIFTVILLGVLATGLDFESAFSAVAACLNNMGAGLGVVGSNFGEIPDTAKWLLSFAMVIGRLEIFTLLVLFNPAFWRH